jgi:hypothetical protein
LAPACGRHAGSNELVAWQVEQKSKTSEIAMSVTKTKTLMIRGGALGAAIALGAFIACEPKGPPRPKCEDVSDAGTNDAVAIPPYTLISTDAQPIEAYGMESDPGPQCTDCRQDDDYEIMAISDFEDGYAAAWFNYGEPGVFIEPPQAGEPWVDDGEGNIAVSPGKGPPQPWWGLQVADLKSEGLSRCGSNYALHLEGARFTSWGGGYVTRHFVVRDKYMDRENLCGVREGIVAEGGVNDVGDPLLQENQPFDGGAAVNGVGGQIPRYLPEDYTTTRETATGCIFWASPVAGQPSMLGFDVSDFEGVSFWARRGPSGQATLRVALIDDNVSDTLALYRERIYYEAEKRKNPMAEVDIDKAGALCTRTLECCVGCGEVEYNKYFPPTTNDDGTATAAHCEPVKQKRCHTPGEPLVHCRPDPNQPGQIQIFNWKGTDCGDAPTPETPEHCWTVQSAQQVADDWDDDFPLCCPPTVENEDPGELNGDPRYGGSECKPYVFNYDQSSGNYCYHEGDVLPEKNQNRCGEGFEASVVVDTEWKLYTIPWAELRRFTPDKPPLDPHRLWQVAFYFSSGYLDTYVDDVGFYKRRPNAR